MKKFVKSAALAVAFACSVPAAAQAQGTQRETPAQAADSLCASFAADPQVNITCTPEQKTRLTALIERVVQMPVTDRYSQMAQQYTMLEGLRQIFYPTAQPIPQPPKDKFEEGSMALCLEKAQATGVGCTVDQFTKLVDFFKRLDVMPEPATVEQVQERQQFIRSELGKIFPEINQAPQQAPTRAPTQRLLVA